MTIAAHVLVFIGIILALAVGDLAVSFHRLMTGRSRVRWYWPVLLLAIVQLAAIIEFYWVDFYLYTGVKTLTIARFAPDVVTNIVLFLQTAAILPDEVREETDLRAHYWNVARYYWILQLLIYSVIFVVYAPRTTVAGSSLIQFIDQWSTNLTSMAIAVLLIVSRREWVHRIGILCFAIVTAYAFYDQSIG